MNKPASELIALADELSFAADNTQGCLYSQRKMLHAAAGQLRTAANQSGERAGVDALADELEAAANWMQLYLDTFGEIGDDATQANINDWHDTVKQTRLTAPQQQSSEAWRYEIQYGPDGETDYAWVYDEKNNLVCTAKTHHAIAIVRALATPPAQPAPASGDKPNDNFPGSPKATDLCIDCGGSRKYPSGADCISCDGSGRVFEGDGIKPHGKPDGAVRDGREELALVAHEIRCARDAYLDNFGSQGNADRKAKLMQVMFDDAGTIISALNELATIDKIAAAETSPGDVLAMKEACKRIVVSFRHQVLPADRAMLRKIEAAIDRLDVKAEAKSQEPDAVASYPWPKALCVYRHEGNYWHGDISFARAPTDAEINALGAFLRDHHENTTKPEAPAVSVDAIARLIDPDSFCLCDETGGLLRTVECDEATTKATAIAALIAGGR